MIYQGLIITLLLVIIFVLCYKNYNLDKDKMKIFKSTKKKLAQEAEEKKK